MMNYKLIEHKNQGFLVMSASDFTRWNDHLNRRFEDCAEAGNVHVHVRVDGKDHRYATVEEYLAEFTVRDLSAEDAHVLVRLFPNHGAAHHACYGPQEIFQPYPGS